MSFIQSILSELRTHQGRKSSKWYSIANFHDAVLVSYLRGVNKGKIETLDYNVERGGYIMTRTTTDNVNRTKWILEDKRIVPLEMDLHFQTEYDPAEKFIPPMRKEDTDPAIWREIRIKQEQYGVIAGPMKFPQTLAAVIVSALQLRGPDILKSKYLSYLKWYVSLSDKDMFTEGPVGQIWNLSYDSIAPQRMNLLLNAFLFEVEGTYLLPVLEEMVECLMIWPFKQQMKVKDAITFLKTTCMCNSTKGIKLRWKGFHPMDKRPRLDTFVSEKIDFNDSGFLARHEQVYLDGLRALDELKLVRLKQLYIYMLDAEVNDKNVKLLGLLNTPHNLVGFMRADLVISYREQLGKKGKYDKEGVPMGKHLVDIWEEMMFKCGSLPYMPWSEREFLRQVPGIMTSRSAGGDSVEISTISKKWERGSIPTKTGKFKKKIRFTDKIMNFAFDPFGSISKKELGKWTSKKDYNKLGNRYTPMRPPRGIYMNKTREYIKQATLGIPFNDVMSRRDNIKDPLKSMNSFTVGKESGNPILDHAAGAYYSSLAEFLILLADYSQFDNHQEFGNMRRYMIEGIRKGAERLGWLKSGAEDKFLGWANFVECFIDDMKSKKQAYYSLGKNAEVVITDIVNSGELITLTVNGQTNKANVLAFLDKLNELKNTQLSFLFTLVRMYIQGDDSVQFWQVARQVRNMDVTDLVKLFVEASEEDGLKLNFDKTTARFSFYEYLKKIFIYGRHAPLFLQTLFTSAENQPAFLDNITKATGICGVLRVMTYRGFNHQLATYIRDSIWNFSRSMNIESSKAYRKKVTFILPYAVLWLPIEFKGVGESVEGLVFPAKDGLIMYKAMHNEDFHRILSNAAHVMDVEPPNEARRLARAYFLGTETEPKKPMEKYEEYTNKFVLEEGRMIASAKAQKTLRSMGISMGDLVYTNFTKNIVIQTIAANGKVVRLNFEAKKAQARRMEYLSRSKHTSDLFAKRYDWMRGVHMQFGEEIERVLSDCPIAGLSNGLREISMRIGVTLNFEHHRKSLLALLGYLRRDQGFPRYITEDNLYEILSQPNIANFPERIVLALVSLGVNEVRANAAVSTFLKEKDRFRIYVTSKTLARNDHFVSMLDLSEARLTELIEMPKTGYAQVDAILREIALGMIINESQMNGKLRKIRITFNDETRANMMKTLTGRKYHGITRHMKLYGLYDFQGKL